jgi:hypothetical protein
MDLQAATSILEEHTASIFRVVYVFYAHFLLLSLVLYLLIPRKSLNCDITVFMKKLVTNSTCTLDVTGLRVV